MNLFITKFIRNKEGVLQKIEWFWRKKEITLEDVYYDYSNIRVRVLFTFGQYCDKLRAQGWRIV